MSKPIKLTDDYLKELREEFEKALKSAKFADGRITFSKTFSNSDRKATVYFSAEAWTKMVMLLKEFDKEVAWHGVAHRVEDESQDGYVIDDIVVYPQEVSGTTVEMDTEKYAEWLMKNADDERFNNIHMQGHSHVNMATSPSSVDLNHQEEILNMLGDDDFYIFMIWNKSFASTNKIYDLKKNVLFDNMDITVKLLGQDEIFDQFIKEAKAMVKTKTYTSSYTGRSYSSPYGQSYPAPVGTPYNPISQPHAAPAVKKETTPVVVTGTAQKQPEEKPRTRIGAGWHGKGVAGQVDMLEDDGGYDEFGCYGYNM